MDWSGFKQQTWARCPRSHHLIGEGGEKTAALGFCGEDGETTGTRARVRAHLHELAVDSRPMLPTQGGRLPSVLLWWVVLEVVLPVRLDGCYLALLEGMQRCESLSAGHPPRRSTEQQPDICLSAVAVVLMAGCNVRAATLGRLPGPPRSWMRRQLERAAAAGGFQKLHGLTGERSVGVANRGPLSLGTYPGVQSDRTVGSLGEAWRVRGRGWGSLRGAWHFFSPSPSFNCIDAAAQSVVSPHRRTRRHGSIIGAPDKQWTWTRTRLESSGHEIPRLPGGLLSVVRHCVRRPSRETAESACEAVAHLPRGSPPAGWALWRPPARPSACETPQCRVSSVFGTSRHGAIVAWPARLHQDSPWPASPPVCRTRVRRCGTPGEVDAHRLPPTAPCCQQWNIPAAMLRSPRCLPDVSPHRPRHPPVLGRDAGGYIQLRPPR